MQLLCLGIDMAGFLAQQFGEMGREVLLGNPVKHLKPDRKLATQLYSKQSSLLSLIARLA